MVNGKPGLQRGQRHDGPVITARLPADLRDQPGPDAIAVIGAELVHLRGLSLQLVPVLVGPTRGSMLRRGNWPTDAALTARTMLAGS